MPKQQTHNVAVHKAELTLRQGESLDLFTSNIRDAGVKFIKLKLNLGKNIGIYPVEIFSTSIVFVVDEYDEATRSGRTGLYAMSYSRKNNGDFEFDTLTEVERITTYQSKTTGITKSSHPGWGGIKLWQNVL